jgi:hypothetical protein
MKKMLFVLCAIMLMACLSFGTAMASPPTNPGPGYYEKVHGENAGVIKYFPNGQPSNQSEWRFVGVTNPVQTSTSIAIAAPYFVDSGLAMGNASDGGWSVGAAGSIDVTAYAQGTKSADTTAFATGTAFGIGGSLGIETDHFGFGVSGALSTITLLGLGDGLGIDKFSFTKNPDFASVEINYSGEVLQSNGILVDNGAGTFAGGYNQTGATFSGGSYNASQGKIFGIDILIPAVSVGADGAGAVAGGFTVAGYIDTPNFATAYAKTYGFSVYCGDNGSVSGSGFVQHQAFVGGEKTSQGISSGTATFDYSSKTATFGSGIAQTSGWTKIQNTPVSSTVTSFSTGSSSVNLPH